MGVINYGGKSVSVIDAAEARKQQAQVSDPEGLSIVASFQGFGEAAGLLGRLPCFQSAWPHVTLLPLVDNFPSSPQARKGTLSNEQVDEVDRITRALLATVCPLTLEFDPSNQNVRVRRGWDHGLIFVMATGGAQPFIDTAEQLAGALEASPVLPFRPGSLQPNHPGVWSTVGYFDVDTPLDLTTSLEGVAALQSLLGTQLTVILDRFELRAFRRKSLQGSRIVRSYECRTSGERK